MVTSDDEATTDIIVEGDQEEITRMTKELNLQVSTRLHMNALPLLAGEAQAFSTSYKDLCMQEKGKVRVKGLLEG